MKEQGHGKTERKGKKGNGRLKRLSNIENLRLSVERFDQQMCSLLFAVKEEIFVGEKCRTFPSKTFRMEFNFVLSEQPSKRRDDRKVCKRA